MPTMISEVYDALLDAGASEEKARKAAEAVAAYDQRFAGIDVKLEALKGELQWVKWMLGTNVITSVAIAWIVWK